MKRKCRHPTFKFRWFKKTSLSGWTSCGWKVVCGKCGKGLTIGDIRKQKRTLK